MAERSKAVLKRVSGHFKRRIKFGKSSPSAVPGANARLFQWMGWPVGPQYAASSNVENAAKLQGKLLLIVGELDTNVDPSSTLQVANALIKANKNFDLLYVPGGGHGAGGAYGQRLLDDFFVHNLLAVEPPDWNRLDKPAAN